MVPLLFRVSFFSFFFSQLESSNGRSRKNIFVEKKKKDVENGIVLFTRDHRPDTLRRRCNERRWLWKRVCYVAHHRCRAYQTVCHFPISPPGSPWFPFSIRGWTHVCEPAQKCKWCTKVSCPPHRTLLC